MSKNEIKDTSNEASADEHTEHTTSKKMTSAPTLVIALIALLAGSISALYAFNLNQSLSLLNNTTSNLKTQINDIKSQSDQQHTALQTTQDDIKSLIQKHLAQEDWQLAELHYLIQAANWQLTFQKNQKIALSFLMEALKKANTLQKPTLAPLIKILNNNIAALNAVTPINISETLLTLSSINQQVTQLPLIKRTIPEQTKNTQTAPTKQNIWQRGLQTGLSAIKHAVVIRRTQSQSPALIKPEEHGYLVDNIQLQIGLAQWALLNKKPKLYNQSITTAQQLIQTYFDMNAPSTKHVLDLLAPLSLLDVSPKLPDINDSLTAINSLINAKSGE